MALHFHPAIKTDCPFLAHPPPQKKRPLQPLPPTPSSTSPESIPAQATRAPHRRSSFSAIASWAAHVQPGSPASLSPRSPHRYPSLCKRRRPSVASNRVPTASFLHIMPTPTSTFAPTPSIRDFKPDLTTVGYTSVFLQLPKTPTSVTLSLPIKPSSPNATKNLPIPPVPSPSCKPHGFTRFRSLSILRSRGRSKFSGPASATKMEAKAAGASAAVVKRKKAKYAIPPPPLANDLALMQFTDGGNMDDNIKRVMEAQAKVVGAVGLADVYRDGEGGIWCDQDEEWEYAHLLGEGDEACPRASADLQWVTFGNMLPSTAGIPGEERRGSMSTLDSDLDPKYVVQPVDLLDGDDLALFGSAVLPARKSAVSVLSLPSRPRRTAQHLRKPDFLVHVAFPRSHASPKGPRFPTSSGASARMKPKGKARRRPAPLKLSPPSPARKQATNSPIDPDKARKDFIAASFEPMHSTPVTPVMPTTAVSVTTPVQVRPRLGGSNGPAINVPWRTVNDGLTTLGIKRKPSVLNMMGLFRSARKEAMMA